MSPGSGQDKVSTFNAGPKGVCAWVRLAHCEQELILTVLIESTELPLVAKSLAHIRMGQKPIIKICHVLMWCLCAFLSTASTGA